MIHMETVRLTASQALVRFLENQYISYIDMDGNEQEHKFVKGIFMLPGHGNVVGFANGVEQELKDMVVTRARTSRAWLWLQLATLSRCAASPSSPAPLP